MDADVAIDFTIIKHEFESKVTTLKSEEKESSITSDYAEEDVASNTNSVATNNVAEVSDVSLNTQDVKPNNTIQHDVTNFTEDYLSRCFKNLLDKIDRLKVDFHDLEDSFLNKSKEATILEHCRKRLTYIIVLMEKVSSWKDNLGHVSTSMCRALDSTYRTLCGINEQLLKLADLKADKIIIKKIEDIINYANNHIRNVVLALNERDLKPREHADDCTIVCEIEYSNDSIDIKPEVIDIFSSDSECDISTDKIILEREVVIKLERLEDTRTSPSQDKESTSLSNIDHSDTDDSIVKNNTVFSSEQSSDPSYYPSDSITDDYINNSDIDSSCEKSQNSKKRHSNSIKRKRSKKQIVSDSSDGSENEKIQCRRARVSASKKQMLAKLRKTLQTNTSDESNGTKNRKKIPPVPVRCSNKTQTPSQLCSNSLFNVDNPIDGVQQRLSQNTCSSDNVDRPEIDTPERMERLSDGCDDSSDTESVIINLEADDEYPRPQAIYTEKIKRKHKIKLIGIRNILRNLL